VLTALLLATAMSGLFEISDRTEVRTRDESIDVENALHARLELATKRTRLSFSYVPRFTLWDLNVSPQPTLMQEGAARLEWSDRRVRWWLDETGSYGNLDMTAMSQMPTSSTETPQFQPVPVGGLLAYGASNATFGVQASWERAALDWRLGYQLAGGADAASQALLPLQYGPFADVRLEARATRRTRFVTELAAEHTTFSSGPDVAIGTATEGWRFSWSRSVETELALGAGEVWNEGAYVTHPVAEASLEDRLAVKEDRVSVRAIARLAPELNRVYGTVDERAEALVIATWTHARVATSLLLTAQQTVPADDPNAVQLLAGEVGVSIPTSPAKTIVFDVGARVTGERLSTEGTQTSFLQGIVFVGLSLDARPIRF